MEVAVHEKLDMTWQCTPATQKANCMQGFIKRSMTSKASFILPSGGPPAAPSSGMPRRKYRKDTNSAEENHENDERAGTYEDVLRELGLFIWEKR